MRTLLVLASVCLWSSAMWAADTLDIYVLDTEGGKAMILRTPDGETMLVDAGYPTEDDRDTKRIVDFAQAAGIKQFDYVVATHYDADHSGNIPRVDAQVPGKVFVDHGEPIATLDAGNREKYYEPYVKAIGARQRMSVKPGDAIPLKGCRITVVTAGGNVISEPLPGAGQPNALAPASRPVYQDRGDNAGSLGLLYEFGQFRMLDLADLLSPIEYDLVCPRNLVGAVDLYMVSHHGFKVSNAKFLVHAVRPKAIVMNNGARKGGDPETLEILKTSPGVQDLWQLHYSRAGGENNAAADFIANPTEPCEAKWIKVTAQRDGAFTVTNARNGFSKTYRSAGGFPRAILSPEVSPERSVTFRLRAPNATEVSVVGELPGGVRKMTKDEQGVWSATVGPLPPELYGYTFVVDGVRLPDPANPHIKPMRSPTVSVLDIPGDPPLLHDFQDVPHGVVRVHHYRSRATNSLRRMHIYTPPGYDQDVAARFPTLYLFHGSGDNDACWTVLGRAHWILDNLLAQGKVKPMVVVMTDGHAAPPSPPGAGGDRNREIFQKDLLGDVMPFVEANYRVKPDRMSRAIVGLSMGGGQSLAVGLNHLELFAWIGGMSSALREPETTVAGFLADPKAANDKLRLLWIACGKDDRLIEGVRKFSEILSSKGIKHTFRETDGAHSWPVWRKHLAEFAPLLFTNVK